MSRRARVVSCDASYRDGVAGVAAVLSGRDVRVLFLDVAEVDGSTQGERMAIEKAMTIAQRARWDRVIFRTDCKGIKVHREMPKNWSIERIPRGHNVAAHTCATQALKLWEAGRKAHPTLTGSRYTTTTTTLPS